ncbi:MAG TPA: outer membrane beta-barrel protein [Kofleriaceae bacterium]
MLSATRYALVLLALSTRVASAQSAPPPSDPSTPVVLKVTGYVEAFYQYNFNEPSNLITAYRDFDDRTSSFTIDNAVLDVTGAVGAVSTRIALQVGHTPATYYGGEPTYAAQAGIGATGPDLWRLIQQAIIGYKVGDLQTEAGIFLSPVGLENVAIKDQWNWSRSTPFFALPYYHAGVRVTYPLSDEVTGVFYVTNGWNDIVNRNPYPCFAGVLTWAPTKTLATTLVYFGGVEDATNAPEGQPWRHLFDVTATWQATADVAFAAQADAGFEPNHFGTSRWFDGAAYVRIHPASRLYVAARLDAFHEYDSHDADGAASRLFFPADDVESGTLTADFRPTGDHVSVRLEYRLDHASTPMYFRGQVQTDPTGNDVPTALSQQTLTLGVVTWF